jgi:hypothetical protein
MGASRSTSSASPAGEYAFVQSQGGHAAMTSDFIIRNNRNVYQRESAAVELPASAGSSNSSSHRVE